MRNENLEDFAKLFYVFDEMVKNAQPIETHTDKYAETKRETYNLKQDYVLVSAFEDGQFIYPVEFNVKEYMTEQRVSYICQLLSKK